MDNLGQEKKPLKQQMRRNPKKDWIGRGKKKKKKIAKAQFETEGGPLVCATDTTHHKHLSLSRNLILVEYKLMWLISGKSFNAFPRNLKNKHCVWNNIKGSPKTIIASRALWNEMLCALILLSQCYAHLQQSKEFTSWISS